MLPMKTNLTHTRNSLPQKNRIEAVALLQQRLADSIDLMLQAKQAHWNIKGFHFIALHELFDKVFSDTVTYMDLIAERIVQLGGTANGTLRSAALQTGLPDYPLDFSSSAKHVAQIAHALAFFSEGLRDSLADCERLEDPATADILTQVARGVDVNLWFVEAHEQVEH